MAKATLELKYKRLKVGHACYVCRSKKIKCDGLRPCMQCKARGRTCESSSSSSQSEVHDGSNSNEEQLGTATESDDDSILFSRTPKNSTADDISITSSSTDDNWSIDTKRCTNDTCKSENPLLFGQLPFSNPIQWKEDSELPMKYSCPIEMPSSDVQMQMIELFFRERYCTTPIVPKKLFYEQLRSKGPMITPLLLNAIYCDVSSFASTSDLPEVPKPAVFFNRAKRLLDDFLDKPRVSTVIALSLLSRYEPRPSKSKLMVDHHSRTWMYSGMAFRMCLELGLNVDTPKSRGTLSEEEIELRRRALWFCYCLDKEQSLERDRTWSLPSSDINTQLPSVLPDDEYDQGDEYVIACFQQQIKLMTIGEQILRLRVLRTIADDIPDSLLVDQATKLKLKIIDCGDSLPSNHAVASQKELLEGAPMTSGYPPLVAVVQLLYCLLLSKSLEFFPKSETTLLEQHVNASRMVQCIETLCSTPYKVTRFEQLAYATMVAALVLAKFLNSTDTQIAQQSQHLYTKCSLILKKIQKHAFIPECAAAVRYISVQNQQDSPKNTALSIATSVVDNDSLHELASSSPSTTHTQSLPSPEYMSSEQFMPQSIYNQDLLYSQETLKHLDSMLTVLPPVTDNRIALWNDSVQCLNEYPLPTSPSDMLCFSYPTSALAPNTDCTQLPNYLYQHHPNPSLVIDPIVHMSHPSYSSQENIAPFVQSEESFVYSLGSMPPHSLMPQAVYYS